MSERLVVIRGGGDLGSGVALRLWRSGFRITILETDRPRAVRRTVALSEAVFDGTARVEELQARLVHSHDEAAGVFADGEAAVLVDPHAHSLADFEPDIVVDSIMAKRNLGTTCEMAGLVIALGPGFVASQDVHAVVETNRGPYLGRVYWSGTAQRNTGQPGAVMGKTASRVLRAPGSGRVQALRRIGEIVHKGEVVARVNHMEVRANFTGLLRGMIREGLIVSEGMKIGDIDPRLEPELVTLVSDKALAVAGGVLEAAMMGLRHNRV